MSSSSQNSIVSSSSQNSIASSSSQNSIMFRKSEYLDLVKKKREEFVLDLFSEQIDELSKRMKTSASFAEECKESYLFTVKEWYDLSKIEKLLQEYFRDCGYTVSSQIEEKENKKTVKITLS